MSGVFINYRSGDHPIGAAAVHDSLVRRFGAENVFRDCASMRPGDFYPSTIWDALRNADVLVAIVGPDWLSLTDSDSGERLIDRSHDWVRREIVWALEHALPIVPVMLMGTPRDTHFPRPTDVPADMKAFTLRQAMQIHHTRLGEDIDRLADRLVEIAPALRGARPAGPQRSTAFFAVVDALEDVPSIADPDTRAVVVAQLRPAISGAVRTHAARRAHVIGILRACLNYDGGVDELVSVIRDLEHEDSPAVRRLAAAAQALQAE